MRSVDVAKTSLVLWIGALALVACGGSPKPEVVAPAAAAPRPPTDPLAWLPEDMSVIGRLDLDAWRTSALAKQLDKLETTGATWVDLDRVKTVHLGFEPKGDDDVSAVGVLTGDFGPGYLQRSAQALGVQARPYGGTDVYAHEETEWFQVSDDTIVGGTPDRISALIARQVGGPDAAVRKGVLYTALAADSGFEQAHIGLLVEDADRAGRDMLKSARAEGGAIGRAFAKVHRGAVRVQFDDGVTIDAFADAEDEGAATSLADLVGRYFESWRRNPMLVLFGLRDVLRSLTVHSKGVRVSVHGQVTKLQLDSLIARFEPMLDNLLEVHEEGRQEGRAPAAPPAGGVLAPAPSSSPAP